MHENMEVPQGMTVSDFLNRAALEQKQMEALAKKVEQATGIKVKFVPPEPKP